MQSNTSNVNSTCKRNLNRNNSQNESRLGSVSQFYTPMGNHKVSNWGQNAYYINDVNKSQLNKKIIKIWNHDRMKIFSLIMSLLFIFGPDLKFLLVPREYDIAITVVWIIIIVVYMTEISLRCYLEGDKYVCTLYFWIDIIAIICITTDIHWINDAFTLELMRFSKNYWRIIDNISKCIKIFTRADKIIGLFYALKWLKKKTIPNVNEQKKGALIAEEEQIGEKFDKLLTRRIVTLLLIMVILMNFLDAKIYMRNYQNFDNMQTGLDTFNYFYTEDLQMRHFNLFIKHFKEINYPILSFKMLGYEYEIEGYKEFIKNLRPLEYITVSIDCIIQEWCLDSEGLSVQKFTSTYDNRKEMKIYYIMNILQSLVILIVLIFGVVGFYRAIHDLAIDPIQKMTRKIKNLANNPVAALQESWRNDTNAHVSTTPTEIVWLEKTVTKVCGLLTLGYGEAGADIIATVMKSGTEGDMNPMIPGKKVMGIYGFCDIRNFTDTTEVLEEQVMIFVNEVAEIVHSITAEFMGTANKNIGDAFWWVWKINLKYTQKTPDGDWILRNTWEINQITDMAFIAFIKIIIEIKKSPKLAKYCRNPEWKKRVKDYCVKLGCGLHIGYSIEGAIGSLYKIDASYLSPNVEYAAAIQEKTKDYCKDIIWSQRFVDFLSKETKRYLIELGDYEGEKIYSINLDLSTIRIDKLNENEMDFDDLNLKMEKILTQREESKIKFSRVVDLKLNVWEEYALKDEDIIKALRYKRGTTKS